MTLSPFWRDGQTAPAVTLRLAERKGFGGQAQHEDPPSPVGPVEKGVEVLLRPLLDKLYICV